MRTRRRVNHAKAASGVLALAGIAYFWFSEPPSKFGDAFDAVEIGMAREAVERLVPAVGRAEGGGEGDVNFLSAGRWAGRVGDTVEHVRFTDEGALENDPRLRKSRYARWSEDADANQRDGGRVPTDEDVEYVDRATGAVLGSEQTWRAGQEELTILYDPAGRVIEKVHITTRGRAAFFDDVRLVIADLVDDFWPF
jgi:hypothetical protein